jgi:K+-transporting ATPase KdpF subunit
MEPAMTAIRIVCAVVALALLVYLFAALLKPEKF